MRAPLQTLTSQLLLYCNVFNYNICQKKMRLLPVVHFIFPNPVHLPFADTKQINLVLSHHLYHMLSFPNGMHCSNIPVNFVYTGPLLPCQEKLGIESGSIIDDRLQSSSDLINGAGKQQWRLNQAGIPGGWVALDSDEQPWLQISLYRQTPITGVIVQGREDEDQWVTSYKVQISVDGTSWSYVSGRASEEEVKIDCLSDKSRPTF